ncbi:fatty acid desaturase 2-like protein FADS2P1 [Otolemur garnettii]|uniref:fatty acid desaturase 2-like protein FADS2P1 n=1 Tax=Otolemur garnettii TaxID=30611 RepID=UPI0006441A1F|nr:fatty acid desaturase 2-like protein FADS2P1 [Otolemur garnettii]
MKLEEKCGDNRIPVGRGQPHLGETQQANGKAGAAAGAGAEVCAKQEASGKRAVPGRSLNTYSWQEVQRHNREADQWLVIDRKVYSVTGWADRHPGGRRVLKHCAGEDATDAFRAVHPDLDLVQLYLKPLLIGELAAEEPSQERNKNVSEGLSQNWWNNRHSQHHVKTNIYPKDPDINMGPLFLLGDSQPVKYGKKKIKYIDYERQHLYFYMVELPLLTSVYLNIRSMQRMYRTRDWGDIAWVSSFYIRHFLTFGPFYGVFGTLLLIYLVKFLESPWITYITQMSHIPMKMSTEENQDWLSTQVRATCNVEQSIFNDWFTGHLNFQIEHHLFPTMPRHNYHKVAPLVRSLCAKHGLQYVNKPMLKAFADIPRALKKSAALWKETYYET